MIVVFISIHLYIVLFRANLRPYFRSKEHGPRSDLCHSVVFASRFLALPLRHAVCICSIQCKHIRYTINFGACNTLVVVFDVDCCFGFLVSSVQCVCVCVLCLFI